MSYDIVEKILAQHNGAKFYKADLHIHTPASKDWDEHNPPEFQSEKISPDMLIKASLDAGLEIIAITDHNSVEWCQRIIDAANGTELVVLPGFELTVSPGVHVLAIFPQGKDIAELEKLLTRLGINEFGFSSEMTDDTIENQSSNYKVIRELQEKGALVIPAHIDLDSGIVGRLKAGAAVKSFFELAHCKIFEIAKKIPDFLVSELKTDLKKYTLIQGSDSHTLTDIGKKPIWIKMDEPTLNGISQLQFEPLNRLSKKTIKIIGKTKILGLHADGGILANQVFAFNEDLNCIIGGRGSGKSAIIDYLRFVFGNEPIDQDLLQKFRKRQADLIQNSTKVVVLVEDNDGNHWLYERRFSSTETKIGNVSKYEVDSPCATVYQVFPKEKRIVKFEESYPHFQIEFYGQGEVQSITNTSEPRRQLMLIDNFIRSTIKQRLDKVDEVEKDIRNLEERIVEGKNELEILAQDIGEYEKLKTRVSELENDLKDEQLMQHQKWEDVNNWVKTSITHLDKQIEKVNEIEIDQLEKKSYSIDEDNDETVLSSLLTEIYSSIDSIKIIEDLKLSMPESKKKIDQLKVLWDAQYQAEYIRYTDALKKQGIENLASLNKELAEKVAKIENIETVLIPRNNELETKLGEIISAREKLLIKLQSYWSQMRECRIQATERMTQKLGKDIVIRISDELNVEEYLKKLDEFSPSGIQSREKQFQKIIEYDMNPSQLVKLIRDKDIDSLRLTGITDNTANLLTQITEGDLLQLERIYCSDIALIKLKIDGNERLLSDLSEGEKCTAILSVILLDESCPLIIDQPEDELDHAFIMSNVVQTLESIKQKSSSLDISFEPQRGRQFIIATHNQNIPVLGDAEMIFKMKKKPGKKYCAFENAHGLEHTETIKHILGLEGGTEAFERRRKKYNLRSL